LSSRHARLADEGSQHTVAFSEPFAVSKYELTFADWDASHRWRRLQWFRPNDFGRERGRQLVIDIGGGPRHTNSVASEVQRTCGAAAPRLARALLTPTGH